MKGKAHSDETKAKLASYKGERASSFKHGWSNTPTYKAWSSMHGRCYDPGNNSYKYYGEKGITVCERWHDFVNFLEDMGKRPSLEYQIDRRDPDGNYTPENCRWLTRAENNARKRSGWPARWAKMKDFND